MKSSAVTKQTELCYLVKQWNFILKKVRVKVNPCFEKRAWNYYFLESTISKVKIELYPYQKIFTLSAFRLLLELRLLNLFKQIKSKLF